ncbi:MAG: hypothetical protein GTO04_16290, partial [Planctomycetales bacterium]|nr:hypothetical protein [Planctomycetales bacterium]
KTLGDYLGAWPACRRVAINGSGTWHDDTHTLSDLLWADPAVTCRLLAERLQTVEMAPRDAQWLAALQSAERQAWQVFDAVRTDTFFEGVIVADVVELMPPEAL